MLLIAVPADRVVNVAAVLQHHAYCDQFAVIRPANGDRNPVEVLPLFHNALNGRGGKGESQRLAEIQSRMPEFTEVHAGSFRVSKMCLS